MNTLESIAALVAQRPIDGLRLIETELRRRQLPFEDLRVLARWHRQITRAWA